jgi:sialic acid synthase SpsE
MLIKQDMIIGSEWNLQLNNGVVSKQHCERIEDVEFISSPFSIAAVELLEKLNVKRYKIGSGEVSNTTFVGSHCTNKKANHTFFRDERLC